MRSLMLILIFALLISGSGISPGGGDAVLIRYGQQITPSDLKEYLSIIASDALEGRRTGTRGQKMAAAFISSSFQENGLSAPVGNSYFQNVELFSSVPSIVYVRAGGERFDNFGEILYTGSADSGGEQQTDLIFAGKGAEEDYAQ